MEDVIKQLINEIRFNQLSVDRDIFTDDDDDNDDDISRGIEEVRVVWSC